MLFLINCGLAVRHGEFAGKFRSSLFKGLSEPPRSAVALRRGRNNLILPKRHRRVNAEQCSAEGGPLVVGVLRLRSEESHKWGVPLSIQAIYNCLSAFFFDARGANENCFAPLSLGAQAPPCAWQKRTRRKRSFALASATNAPRVGSAVAF